MPRQSNTAMMNAADFFLHRFIVNILWMIFGPFAVTAARIVWNAFWANCYGVRACLLSIKHKVILIQSVA